MPAVIEGDTGVINGPSAPLEGIYEQMMMDRSTGVAQARNPLQSLMPNPGSNVVHKPSSSEPSAGEPSTEPSAGGLIQLAEAGEFLNPAFNLLDAFNAPVHTEINWLGYP